MDDQQIAEPAMAPMTVKPRRFSLDKIHTLVLAGVGIISFGVLLTAMFTFGAGGGVSKAHADAVVGVTKKVLVLNFNPIIEDQGNKRLTDLEGWNGSDQLPSAVDQKLATNLNQVSHGYMTYTLLPEKVIDGWPVKEDGFVYTDSTYLQCLADTSTCHQPDGIDYKKLIDTNAICASGADEVWMWGGPYFGYQEYSQTVNCGKSVFIMGFNYERATAEAMHDFGHRMEYVMTHRINGNIPWDQNTATAWNLFSTISNHCGNVHFPPGTGQDYEYGNIAITAQSDCDSYATYPTGPFVTQAITCAAWGCDQLGYMKWWLSHIPSSSGTSVDPGSGRSIYNNWWVYFGNYDETKNGLIVAPTPTPVPTPTPSADYGLNVVTNDSFETVSNSDASNWSSVASNSADKTTFHSGTVAMKVTKANPNPGLATQAVKLKPKMTYVLQGWVKTTSVSGIGLQLRYKQTSPTSGAGTFGTAMVTGTKGWTFVSTTFTLPTNYTNGQVELGWSMSGGTGWFDDVQLCESVCKNLLVNPSMEVSVSSEVANWTNVASNSWTNSTKYAGSASMKSVKGSSLSSQISSQPVTVTGGKTYVLQGYVKTQGVTGSAYLQFTTTQPAPVTHKATATVSGTTDWKLVSTTFTAPTNGALTQVDLVWAINAGTVWFDQVMLCDSSCIPTPPAPTLKAGFNNLTANLGPATATFGTTFVGPSIDYVVDMSTTSDFSTDIYFGFASGIEAPVTVQDPMQTWDKYACGNTLYWRMSSPDRTSYVSPIQTATVHCP